MKKKIIRYYSYRQINNQVATTVANTACNKDPKEDKMLEVNFYLNGKLYNGGDVLSFPMEKDRGVKIIQLLDSLKENGVFDDDELKALAVVKTSKEGEEKVIAITSITTEPVEDLDEVDEYGETREFIRLSIDRMDVAMPNWNELVEKEEKRREKLGEIQKEWDSIEIDIDAIRRIRNHFDGPRMTADFGQRVNGKPVVNYKIAVTGDYTLTFQGKRGDVEFQINGEPRLFPNIFEILKSWSAVQDFLLKVEEINNRASGFIVYATYGIDDNKIKAKVLDTECGTTFGFHEKTYKKYGVDIEAVICSRYADNHDIEEAFTALASEINKDIRPLVEVLK